MKKFILYAAAGFCLAACSAKNETIEVINSLDFDRQGELVCATLNSGKLGKLVDASGNEVAYQVRGKEILFQANVPAGATTVYTMLANEKASEVEPLTSAFFLGDRRKDDFCWENDKAAYRMYGPALLPENPSSGVDLWLKHSSQLTADAMYKQEEGGKPYHIDYGLGIDSYKVGHAAGCGGLAIVSGGEVWPGGPFAKYEILQEGALQTIFRLTYDSVQVGDKKLSETITITVNAGANLNKAEVVLNGEAIEDLQIGGAIFLHDSIQNLNINTEQQAFTYAESANSDKGVYRVYKSKGLDANEYDFGRNYCAVIVPGATDYAQIAGTQTATRTYTMGETLTYYFGGAWSKRDYATDEDWANAISRDAKSIASPLSVVVK